MAFRDNNLSKMSSDQLDALKDDELADLMDQTLMLNEVLSKENDVFDKFLKRLDPKDFQSKAFHLTSSQGEERNIKKKGKGKSGSIAERQLKLTAEQKCDVASREVDELREEIERKKEDWEKVLDGHRAVSEEAGRRMDEFKKLQYEFERDVVRGAVNTRTGKMEGEKVVRFFKEQIATRASLVEKLRLKNNALRVRRRKLISQLKQKEEAGDVRNEVDFQQLKIENKQLVDKFDAKNQELLQLKLKSGNTTQVLNGYKKKLQSLTKESQQLESDIQSRVDILTKIEAETRIVQKERDKAEKLNKHLRQKIEDYRVPEVIDYVKERAKVHELEKEAKMWNRKQEIAELTLASQRQLWMKKKRESQALVPWSTLQTS